MLLDIYRPVSVSVFPKIDKRPDWTGLLNTMYKQKNKNKTEDSYCHAKQPSLHVKAIAECGRYESLPIFFGHDAINLRLSMSGFVTANP